MAQLTRIGVGGVGKTYGTITDKTEGVPPSIPAELLTRIGAGGVGIYYSVTDKAEAIPVEPVTPQPEIPATGGGGRSPGYTRGREDALLETRRKRILRDDEEITALIMAMVTEGLI